MPLKPLSLAGIALIVFGVAALYYRQPYTEHKALIDIGSVHASIDREKTFELPPALGIGALAGGAILLALGLRKR